MNRKVIIAALIMLSIFSFSGCTSSESLTPAEKIMVDQAKEDENRKEIANTASQKIMENMKKNSEKTMQDLQKFNNVSTEKIDQAKTMEELIDMPTTRYTNLFSYFMFIFFYKAQKTAIWWCPLISIFGIIFAKIFKDDRPKLKACYWLVATGPIIFLILTYGPAFYWYLLK